MRIARNVVFVVLVGFMLGRPGAGVEASSSSGCDFYMAYDNNGVCPNEEHLKYYSGECEDCDEDSWYDAIETCNGLSGDWIMLEYYCNLSGSGEVHFVCRELCWWYY
jgi:hypothetical protein